MIHAGSQSKGAIVSLAYQADQSGTLARERGEVLMGNVPRPQGGGLQTGEGTGWALGRLPPAYAQGCAHCCLEGGASGMRIIRVRE